MSAMPQKNTMLDYALRYAAMGWHVVPLHCITISGNCSCGSTKCKSPGKHPSTLNGVKDASTNPDVIRNWFAKHGNIGIACGVSGFDVIDIDPRNGGDETWAALVRQHGEAPETVIANTGGGGFHYLYQIPEGMELIRFGPGIDVKKDGGYIVVEPSNHASGAQYQWEGAFDPLEGVAIMPAANWMIRPVGQASFSATPAGQGADYLSPPVVKDLRSALCYIDPDPYENYFNVLASLKGSGDSSQTKGLAMEWARGSNKYDASEFAKKWASISTGGNKSGQLTHVNVFKMAQSCGWVNTISGHITPAYADPLPAVKPAQREAPTFNFMQIPGVLGTAVDWINATSRKPQPMFAVQAALAFGATVLGRKYVTSNRNWSSLYFLNIGKSASGKEHAKWAIERMLDAAGLSALIGPSRYSSESGVLSALIEQPSHITIVDEFGKYLESSNANGNYMAKDTVKILIEAWGRSDGIMRPVGYSTFGMSPAQIDEMQQRVVHCPSLSMLAMGTPESFFDSVSSKGVRDGFLNRFLIAHTDIGRQPGKMLSSLPDVPQSVADWAASARNPVQSGNLAQVETNTIQPTPLVIPFTASAERAFEIFEAACIVKMDELDEIGLAEMYGRCNEIAMRLSLIVAVSCESPVITEEHARWAIGYVGAMQEVNIYHLRDRLADSPFAKMKNDVYRAILDAGESGLTQRDLSRSVYCYRAAKPGQQEEVLQALTKDQDIQLQEKPSRAARGGRPRFAYVAISAEE